MNRQQFQKVYYERSRIACNRASHLCWAFIVLLAGTLAGGNRYVLFFINAAGALSYMLLTLIQALWQEFSMRIFVKEDYTLPRWTSYIILALYWLKMCVIIATTIFAIYHFLF